MNQRMLILERLKNWNKLDFDAYRPKVNALEIDINNKVKHELGKFACVWLIRNGVSADELVNLHTKEGYWFWHDFPAEIENLKDFKKHTKFKHKWEVPEIVTEARFKGGKRRADIYVLDTNEMVEIETDWKIKKKDAITVYI